MAECTISMLLRSRLRRTGSKLADAYAFGLLVALGLKLLPQLVVGELIGNFLGWLLLPAPVVWLVLLRREQWRRAALWTLPALAFAWLYGGFFLPRIGGPPPPADGIPLRVMSYNLFGVRAMDRLPQVAVIRNSGADIIALQEVSDDAVEVLHDHLRDRYPYRVLYPKGVAGTGLLSRYPLLEAEVTELTPGTYNTRAVVDVGGVPITVISAHPPAPITSFNRRYTRRGRREIQRLLGLVRDAPGPVLLMGDFNHADQSRDYRLMPAAGLQDAFREAGWGLGPTWPCRIRYLGRSLPLVRIDYIWTTPHFHIRRCWVGPPGNSDHAPVIADVVVIPGSLRTG